MQIAKQFALLPQYHKVFRSCNRGSKKNIWCCKCAKCLFVYSILSPFLHLSTLSDVFGSEMLSEEPKSEIESWMTNLFDFLEKNAKVDADSVAARRENVRSGGSGSTGYRYGGKGYYLVYQPVGFQDLTIVGIVERDVVDAGMRKIQKVTILLLLFLMGSVAVAMVRSVKLDAALEMEEKENALRTEALERRKLEGLANTDGLTGLFNERCFNSPLKQKEKARQP